MSKPLRDTARLSAACAAVGGLALVVAVTGCSATDNPSATTSASPSAPPAGQTGSGGLAPTETYLAELEGRWSAVIGQDPKAERPASRIIRYVDPTEWPATFATCLTAQGFQSTTTPDGGVTPPQVPPAQQPALRIAQYVCFAAYPMEDKYSAPLDAGQIDKLYDYLSVEMPVCLSQFDIPVTDIPSRQTFIDAYGTSIAWSPYRTITGANLPEAEWIQINVTCPQIPMTLWE